MTDKQAPPPATPTVEIRIAPSHANRIQNAVDRSKARIAELVLEEPAFIEKATEDGWVELLKCLDILACRIQIQQRAQVSP